jgi:hypothetical protein
MMALARAHAPHDIIAMAIVPTLTLSLVTGHSKNLKNK